jgi:hypothetical protein
MENIFPSITISSRISPPALSFTAAAPCAPTLGDVRPATMSLVYRDQPPCGGRPPAAARSGQPYEAIFFLTREPMAVRSNAIGSASRGQPAPATLAPRRHLHELPTELVLLPKPSASSLYRSFTLPLSSLPGRSPSLWAATEGKSPPSPVPKMGSPPLHGAPRPAASTSLTAGMPIHRRRHSAPGGISLPCFAC